MLYPANVNAKWDSNRDGQGLTQIIKDDLNEREQYVILNYLRPALCHNPR
jgi:hypothetical protein